MFGSHAPRVATISNTLDTDLTLYTDVDVNVDMAEMDEVRPPGCLVRDVSDEPVCWSEFSPDPW